MNIVRKYALISVRMKPISKSNPIVIGNTIKLYHNTEYTLNKLIRPRPNVYAASSQPLKGTKLYKEDVSCDKQITTELKSSGLVSAIENLNKFVAVNRYPSRVTFKALIKQCIEKLSLELAYMVKDALKTAYPKEFDWEMGYDHYIAEILWKRGRLNEAMELFEKLLTDYPARHKKIHDTIMFMNRRVISSYSETDLDMLLQFTERCAAKQFDKQITNIWFLLITSQSGKQNIISQDLISKHDDVMRQFVQNKIDGIVKIASSANDLDLLQRLVEAVLTLKLPVENQSKVFSAMLRLQCENEDGNGALRTLRHVNQEGIVLSGEDIKMFADFNKGNKK